MNLRQCDECKQTGPVLGRWISVRDERNLEEKPAWAFMAFDVDVLPRMDFCSWSCVSAYAMVESLEGDLK